MSRRLTLNAIVFLVLFFVIYQVLHSGALLSYAERHRDGRWTPKILYAAGHVYYALRSLSQAETYFLHVEKLFPRSAEAERAFFFSRQIKDDLGGLAREELVQQYEAYLKRYPQGRYAARVRSRINSYQTGIH